MEDKELKERLEKLDVPPPSDGAKERAVNLAMQAFAEKNRQGSLKEVRLTDTTMRWKQFIGRLSMKNSYVFAGSMATIAVVLAITTTHYSSIMQPVMIEAPKNAAAPLQDNDQAQIQPSVSAVLSAPSSPKEELAKSIGENKQKAVAAGGNIVLGVADHAPPPPSVAPASAPLFRADKKDAEMGAAGAQYQPTEARRMTSTIMPVRPTENYPALQMQYEGQDQFEHFQSNPLKIAAEEPVSTFSIDVDTSSYSFVRRMLNQGQLPQKDMVRIEEMINYFPYHYAAPESKAEPFKPAVAVYPTPWNPDTKLVHIGIKGHDVAHAKPRSNLVFLIDVSGSMKAPDRLPLVKNALRMLVDQLNPEDTVGIVVYAGNVGTVLEPTKIAEKGKIVEALSRLEAGGSTAGGEGIRQAYALAEAHFDKNAVNRVILSTDGDFNVGITDPQALQDYIEQERKSGIYFSVLGVGQGNYNDALMQKLAQHGNGNAAYIDTLNEARKVLVEEAGSTLFTIAGDVKIQVEFNPAAVSQYRLIGYESRLLNREDFNNDKVDAGEVGSGHAVTAIYEITPASARNKPVDELRYGKPAAQPEDKSAFSGEYAFLKIRYKLPGEERSKLLTTPIGAAQEVKDIANAPEDTRFATAVAAFGQLLKGDTHLGNYRYDEVISLADGARGKDEFGYRAEFTNLARLAKALQQERPSERPLE